MISKLKFDVTQTLFEYETSVLVSHLNYGNHLGYDSVLSLLHDARMQWLKIHEMSELSIDGNTGWMVSEANISYKSEGSFGDDLVISLYTTDIDKRFLTLVYSIHNKTTNKLLAVATTKHVFFDFNTGKLSRAPENFKNIITLNPLNCSSSDLI